MTLYLAFSFKNYTETVYTPRINPKQSTLADLSRR
jgi:hypothetical protein